MARSTPEPVEDVAAEDVAARIARQSLANRAPDYAGEVRRLLDAGREVIRRCGTDSRPRVADIVATAGLSNDAFYRHFSSKDALVAAILEDGTDRLRSYLEHQMAKEQAPEARVRRWVEGVLAQADDDAAATTLGVLWNSAGIADAPHAAHALAPLLHDPFAELGSGDPELHGALVAHALVGILSDHLWRRTRPTSAQTDAVVAFCLDAVRA